MTRSALSRVSGRCKGYHGFDTAIWGWFMMKPGRLIKVCALAAVVVLALPAGAGAQARGVSHDTGISAGPDVIPLGLAFDKGRLVEGFLIVHEGVPSGRPKVSQAKGGKPGGSAPGGGKDGGYAFLAKGARWKVVPSESWVVNTANSWGLDETTVFAGLDAGAEAWDSQVAFDIFGAGTTTQGEVSAETNSPDGYNEVMFGSAGQNTIAYATVWGTFGGPLFMRELVEFDLVFNDAMPWASDGRSDAYDFQSIATHELGHAVGLADIYDSKYDYVTMYGYGHLGDLGPRSLESPDIKGVRTLYE